MKWHGNCIWHKKDASGNEASCLTVKIFHFVILFYAETQCVFITSARHSIFTLKWQMHHLEVCDWLDLCRCLIGHGMLIQVQAAFTVMRLGTAMTPWGRKVMNGTLDEWGPEPGPLRRANWALTSAQWDLRLWYYLMQEETEKSLNLLLNFEFLPWY